MSLAQLEGVHAVEVVPYGDPHLPGVRALWSEYFGEDAVPRREEVFRWLTTGNPLAAGTPGYFLLLDGSRVAGMHGHMPLEYRFGHERIRGYMGHDDLLGPGYRGRGLGQVVLRSVAKQAPHFSGALWHNEPNYRLYAKCWWTGISGFYRYVKILDPSPFLRRRVPRLVGYGLGWPAKKALSAIERMRPSMRSEDVRIETLECFDEELDALFERICCAFGFIVTRSAAYLNWRFVRKPSGAYRIRGAYDRGGQLCGYAVLKIGDTEGALRGQVVDLLADSSKPAIFDSLIDDACAQLIGTGVSSIEIACTHRPFVTALPRHGFFKARTPCRFMASNWENRFSSDLVTNIDNWYLTFSDADGDAWAPDRAWPLPAERAIVRELRSAKSREFASPMKAALSLRAVSE